MVLEKGRGRVQLQGQPLREMLPGQPLFLPAGVPHWHGAAPNEGITLLSMSIGGVKWMQAVSDQEYQAPVKP
jgi:quercetin dioxygenase-like cupin family protein